MIKEEALTGEIFTKFCWFCATLPVGIKATFEEEVRGGRMLEGGCINGREAEGKREGRAEGRGCE